MPAAKQLLHTTPGEPQHHHVQGKVRQTVMHKHVGEQCPDIAVHQFIHADTAQRNVVSRPRVPDSAGLKYELHDEYGDIDPKDHLKCREPPHHSGNRTGRSFTHVIAVI